MGTGQDLGRLVLDCCEDQAKGLRPAPAGEAIPARALTEPARNRA